MKKLAVLFPGIGYTVDKPLLYHSGRIAAARGYEVLPLPYGGFPRGVKGDRAKMERCFRMALEQAEEMLAAVDWAACDRILFIGKSVGTIVAAAAAQRCPAEERIRFLLYTPLEDTFAFPLGESLVFTGGADPWVGGGDSRIPALCAQRGLPCTLIPGANHSLETGDPLADLDALRRVMAETERFLRVGEAIEE